MEISQNFVAFSEYMNFNISYMHYAVVSAKALQKLYLSWKATNLIVPYNVNRHIKKVFFHLTNFWKVAFFHHLICIPAKSGSPRVVFLVQFVIIDKIGNTFAYIQQWKFSFSNYHRIFQTFWNIRNWWKMEKKYWDHK